MNSTENEQNAPDEQRERNDEPPRDDDFSRRCRGRRGMRRGFHPMRAAGILALVALCFTVFGFVTERLWNWLMPSIFHLRSITFFEAVGLVLLGKILFGGVHRKHRYFGRSRGRGGRGWQPNMKARFEAMTPEEREKFRAGMRRGGRWNCRSDRRGEPSQPNQGGL